MSVLRRERRDVAPEVEAAGPPTVPALTGRFRLRLVDPAGGDPAMLAEWFSRPHLAQTWEQDWPAPQWAADSAARLAGDYSRPLIVDYDGSPVAYIELYRVARDEIAQLYPVDPTDIGFHIATAETALIGRGVMSGFIGELAEAVFAADPDCRRFVGEPAASNERIRRALLGQGFVDLGEFDIWPDRRVALHIRPRAAADLPQPAESVSAPTTLD